MGNCLLLMSFEPPLPSPFPFPSSTSPALSSLTLKQLSGAVSGFSDDASSRSSSAFTSFSPILPFSTPSDLIDLYSLGPELGRGQFGIIRSCKRRSSGTLFACKSIPKIHLLTVNDTNGVVCEASVMKHLSDQTPQHGCPPGHIVRLHEVVEDSFFVHLIMDLCNGGELFDRIVKKDRYPEAQAAFLMKSLLEALQLCHSMGIMHRDLKPENILLVDESDTSDIKLADFGLALQFSPGQKFSGMVGSTYYVAPEVLQGTYSQEIDMWSAGVIMYVLLSGVPPFWGLTEQSIFNAIREGQLDFTSDPWHTISSSAKELITHLLCTDVKSRWTPAQALKHPWIIHHTSARQMSEACIRSADVLVAKQENPVSPATCQHTEHGNQQQSTSARLVPASDLVGSNMIGSQKGKPELDVLLADLVANLDKSTLSLSESLTKVTLPGGWTCTFLTVSPTEETMSIDMGEEKYLVVHDRRRKRVGWKAVRQQQRRRRTDEDLMSSLQTPQTLQPVF